MIQAVNTTMLDQINTLSVMGTSMLVDLAEQTTDAPMLMSATAKLRELRLMLATLAGQSMAVHPRLLPLSRAINTLIQEVSEDNNWFIEGMSEDEIVEGLEKREDIVFALNQARMLGYCLMAHLNTAITTLPKKEANEPSKQS